MTDSVARVDDKLKELLEGLDVVVLKKALEWARQAYQAILEKIDQLLLRTRGRGLAVQHVRQAWYNTVLGRVRVERRQYREEEGKYRYLLDELMGVEGKGHTTAGVKRLALELASEMSFRTSARILEETTAVHLSHQTVWSLVGRVADPWLERLQKEVDWLLETGELAEGEGKQVPLLVMEADGMMLSLQRERAKKAEVKVGIAYEGWKPVGRSRHATVAKTIHFDVAGGERYWAGMTLKLAKKYDLGQVERVVIGGDGAEWIKDGLEYFAGIPGQFQLCRYHLRRELTAALGPDRAAVRAVLSCCERGEVEAACQLLLEAERKARGEQAKRIGRVRGYLLENRAGLRDYRLALGEAGKALRRTGAMEGNGDKLVACRMKKQGMSWRIQGILRMLCVRFLCREGKLEEALARRTRPELHPVPAKKARRLIDEVDVPHLGITEGALPALYGPHANRYWVRWLKSITQVQVGA